MSPRYGLSYVFWIIQFRDIQECLCSLLCGGCDSGEQHPDGVFFYLRSTAFDCWTRWSFFTVQSGKRREDFPPGEGGRSPSVTSPSAVERTWNTSASEGRGLSHFQYELGTHTPVKARFWSWLEPFSVRKSAKRPLSSELGTHKPVRARCWPWLEPFSARKSVNPFKLFHPRSVAAQQHWGCTVLNLRTPTSQKCEAVPRRARI